MHLNAVMERIWRYTSRPRSSGLRDALGGQDRAIVEMHLEAGIEGTERCTRRPVIEQVGDALRPRWSELRDALGCHDRSRLDVIDLPAIDLDAVNLEAVHREACAIEA